MEQNHRSEKPTRRDSGAIKPWEARHDVQFYDNDSHLAASVAAFLAEGLKSAQPAIVIATPAHTRQLQEHLRRLGVDIHSLGPNDIVWLNARDTLAAFMERGRPDLELFHATVGSVFERVTRTRRYVTVRAYGEMVDLLWREGRTAQALELEAMWNGLASKYSFALLCSYSVDSLDPSDVRGIERICALHSQVRPSQPPA